MRTARFITFACFGLGLGLLAPSAFGQGDKPVRLVVGFPPGAAIDNVARMLAEPLAARLGQTVVVENRTGAGGRIAAEHVKNAPADGTTVFFTPVATVVIFPITYRKLSYDPVRDFEPVAQIATFPIGFAVGANVPVRTLAEYVQAVKADPKNANYSSAALGSLPHFFAVMFARSAGIDLVHVAYRGTADVRTALLGGQIQAASVPLADLAELHKTGRARVLASSGASRSPSLPEVPTFREQGYDIEGIGWYALYLPARTPKAAVDRLAQASIDVVRTPEVRERLVRAGWEPTGVGPAQLAAIMQADLARWTPVIRASGFTPED